MIRIFSIICSTCIVLSIPYQSQAQQLLGSYNQWNVFNLNQQGKNMCYIATTPLKGKTQGSFKKRGEPYLLVTSVSTTRDEVSTSSGFPYQEKSEVIVTIDNRPFKLFTKGEISWAYEDGVQDQAMVNAMKQGSLLSVKGTSMRGTFSKDFYSLAGFSRAYQHMKTNCK